jgi:hypothetical protein
MTNPSFPNPWASISNWSSGGWLAASQLGIQFSALVSQINNLTAAAMSKIAIIRSKQSAMSIADMFDLQMAMNKLTQFSEMSTSVVTAMNQSINDISRNMKS